MHKVLNTLESVIHYGKKLVGSKQAVVVGSIGRS